MTRPGRNQRSGSLHGAQLVAGLRYHPAVRWDAGLA